MTYEESDDAKIRRNLIVFSGLIVLLAWLQVPLTEVISTALKLQTIGRVSPPRLWLACLVFLVYLTHRYWHCADFKSSYARLKGEWFSKKCGDIDAFVMRKAKAYALDRTQHSKYLVPIPEESIRTFMSFGKHRSVKLSNPRFGLVFQKLERDHQDPWKGRVSFEYRKTDNESPMEYRDRSAQFKIIGWRKWQIALWSFLYPLGSSQQTTQLVVPCTVTVCAYGIVVYRLAQATWPSVM